MISNLMLIDDNDLDQKMCARLIQRSGLVGEVHGFLMAEDALDFLAEDAAPRIDAILLDINMPRMDGFEFLDAAATRLGDRFQEIPVFMLSTSEACTDKAQARDYDMVRGYFGKPLDSSRLARLAEIVERDGPATG